MSSSNIEMLEGDNFLPPMLHPGVSVGDDDEQDNNDHDNQRKEGNCVIGVLHKTHWAAPTPIKNVP